MSGTEGTPASLVSFDQFLREQTNNLSLRPIKADVEGIECSVLAGAWEIIGRDLSFLYVENDRPDLSPPLICLMRELGYRTCWHSPLLYSPDNYFSDSENAYPGIAAINMLDIPDDVALETSDTKGA